MPAKSKKQRRFMGMVSAIQAGKKIKGASDAVKKVAKKMDPEKVMEFAKTKEKKLPLKVGAKKVIKRSGGKY